jgi:hypothetical protein
VSLSMRIIFFGMIGIIGGMLAWPLAEVLISFQGGFPSLLVFGIVIGGVVGLIMGGCFGMNEGILSHSAAKLKSGLVMGIIIGVLGGVIGVLLGLQVGLFMGSSFFLAPANFKIIGYPIARALGWAAFGIFIGVVEGIRSKSFPKIKNGIIGGFLGGFLGGLVFEYSLKLFVPDVLYARLLGFVVLGLCIGIFYGFVENKLARASFYVLNGRYKGKEYLLNQRRMTIGKEEQADVSLADYRMVAAKHATLNTKKHNVIIKDTNSKAGIYVNDRRINEAQLKDGDVIRVGEAQFLFKLK